MRIIYFDYNNECLPPLLRSFELTRAAANLGHSVMLCLCHERMRQSAWFFKMLSSSQTDNFSVRFNHPVSNVPNKYSGQTKIHGWKMVRSGIYANRFIFNEIKMVRAFKPDVIVARPDNVYSFLTTVLFARVPLVISPDGPVEELSSIYGYTAKWPVGFDLWRAKKAKAILHINDICGNLWKKKGIADDRLFLCPNGADPEVFKPLKKEERLTIRKSFGFTENEIVLGFCGNQRFWHGLHNLFKSFVEVSEKISNLRLLVIGPLDDPESVGIDGISDRIRSRIIFTGSIEYFQMPRYMDLMDIMVMPYPKFPLFHFSPMKMFESLSMGKVIVASSQGQIEDLLSALPSAFLYDPRQEKGLENAIVSACSAIGQNPSLGEKSRTFLKNGHTWQHRGEQVIAACDHALKNAGQKRRHV